MAIYEPVYPDGTPYPVIPAGTNIVNVSSSSALASALSNATAGQRIVLSSGSYSGSFSMSGRSGTSTSGISIESATPGAATLTSSSTLRITNCAYVTFSGIGLPFDAEGDTFQFRGTSHHCRVTRCTFGPASHSDSGNVSTWLFVGDDCHTIRIDHNEFRNKGTSGNAVRVYGSFDKVDNGQGSDAGCRWVRIDHNVFRSIKPEVGNDKEPVRYGVSTMSRTIANGVIERNVFSDCVCEPEVISVKMGGIRTTGNSILQCIGGPVIRHGTNSVMSDNYIIDRADTFGSTIGSGGIRFYDADHTIAYNYVDGVYGGNYQGPLLLDTGDAEGSSSSLNAHWRVIGAMVERNVIVDCPEGVRIGDNYSSVPRDCTIRHNVVVDVDTGAAITQRVAPSNTVMEPGNTYYATTTAAGMTQDADTVWRKPGYGPRLTYLAVSDVGPSADLTDTDGTGAEVGGEVATPADVLNIGAGDEQNHFSLVYAVNGAGAVSTATFAQVAAGFDTAPYFTTVERTDPDDSSLTWPVVQFQVRADAATSGSSFPRAELQETRADGTPMAFDAMVGTHSIHTRARITHLPSADPEVVLAQLHDGTNNERVSVRTVLNSGETNLLVRVNNTQVLPRITEAYIVGDEIEFEIRITEGGVVSVYTGGSGTPLVTGGQLVSTGSASWYWKVGAHAHINATTAGSSTEYVSVEHRDLRVTHSPAEVDAGADAVVVSGQVFSRAAIERGLTGITRRSWQIVSAPTPPDNGGGDTGDQTIAAIRHNWGTPLPVSDEFDYVGPPNSTKWALPGSDWAGHDGNGRRRPERQTVDGSKMVMTGLVNGDTGWMRQRLDQQYGRWEARIRCFQGAPTAGQSDNTSNGNDYHCLLLLWPESNSRQTDGEYDFYELGVPGQNSLEAFMHFPHPGTEVVQQRYFEKTGVNMSQWHNVGLEWTPDHLKGFIDGEEWFVTSGGANDVRRDIQTMPSGHLVIQLDNFDGTDQTPATIEVEWCRVYAL
jgi:hypothetical protein